MYKVIFNFILFRFPENQYNNEEKYLYFKINFEILMLIIKFRKIKIIAFACKTRQLFMRIYALVKFMKTAHINVSVCINKKFENFEQSFLLLHIKLEYSYVFGSAIIHIC